MEETLHLIQHSSHNSLLLIDELGRGTSTFDGFSIATSVLKYIIKSKTVFILLIADINPRCLFATHYQLMYQEMKQLEHRLRWMKMGSKIVKFGQKEKIIFLYKIIDGISEKSFAINVAQIAGLPLEIIKSATKHLEDLEVNKNK